MNISTIARAFAQVPLWAVSVRWFTQAVAALQAETPVERRARAKMQVVNGVALVPVDGVLVPRQTVWGEYFGGESPIEELRVMLQTALADDQVSTIVLVMDSPGGDVVGVPELADEIFALRGRKPVVAHVHYLAASGAYWLASQAESLWMEPSGEVGSIGVFTLHQCWAGYFEKAGIETTIISAGEHKTEWTPYQPLSEDAKAYAQAQVDEVFQQFLKAVARGRNVSVATVRESYGDGRTLLARPAKAAGMVDRIGTLDELVDRVSARAKRGLRADASDDVVANDTTAPIEVEPSAADVVQRDLDYLSL